MKNVLTIIKKEFTRFFKDRRMVLMIFLPGIMIYALYSIMGTITSNIAPTIDDKYQPTAYFVNLPEGLNTDFFNLKTYDGIDEAKADIENGNLDLAVVFPADFKENYAGVNRPDVKVYYNSANETSSFGYAVATSFLNGINAFTINATPEEVYDLVSADSLATSILSMLIPMLMFALLASSCMAVAPESIAGEKERGTMATMLITPVKRIEIVLGKIISLSCFAMLSGVSSFLGVILSLPKLSGGVFNLSSVSYGVGDYFMLLGLIISIVLVMISAFSVLSTLAKNVKESSAFITPLMIVIIVLGMCTMFFKSPHVAMHLIPFLGSGIAMSSILGLTASPLGVALAILSNVAFAAVLIVLMGFMFKNENIMLKK
ncbi:MAG: ABC transporter permease [Clostridia bacterium]|nr:ABC transporter permease [Clostridia bacterium]